MRPDGSEAMPTGSPLEDSERGRERAEQARESAEVRRQDAEQAREDAAARHATAATDQREAEEERRRGPAMGALGWISLGGDLDLAVAIRTAAAVEGRIVYHAGCGIVADSDPELELAESTVKARAFLAALGAGESS